MSRKIIFGELIIAGIGILLCCFCLRRDAFDTVKRWGLEHNATGRNNFYSSQVGFYEYGYAALTDGVEIVQEFQVTKGMLKDNKLKVALLFGTFGRINKGSFHVELIQGENCQSQSFVMENVEESALFPVVFDTAGLSAGSVFLRIGSPDAMADNCIATYIRMPRKDVLVGMDMTSEKREDTAAMFRNALVNGMQQSGPLAMELYSYTD